MLPPKGAARRFDRIILPPLPALSVAPITATLRGLKKTSSEPASAGVSASGESHDGIVYPLLGEAPARVRTQTPRRFSSAVRVRRMFTPQRNRPVLIADSRDPYNYLQDTAAARPKQLIGFCNLQKREDQRQ